MKGIKTIFRGKGGNFNALEKEGKQSFAFDPRGRKRDSACRWEWREKKKRAITFNSSVVLKKGSTRGRTTRL